MKPTIILLFSLVLAACSDGNRTSDAADATSDATDALDVRDVAPPIDVPVDTGADVPADYLRPPMITRTQPDSVLAMQRQNCMFEAGAWPAETLGTDVPIDSDIPIDHVLLLVMENRSFDHYYSHLPAYGQPDVEVPPAGWSNPDTDGTAVLPAHDAVYCFDDTNHSWSGSHSEWDNGMNDGFVRQNNPNGARAMLYETEADIPFYYSLANTFSIADHFFCSLLGPTLPNRFYVLAATSFGLTTNIPNNADTAAHPANHIFAELDRAGLDWKNYAAGLRTLFTYPYYAFRPETQPHLKTIDDLMTDLASGNLPPFSFIEPNYAGTGGDRYDEHPPGTPLAGERWVEGIVRALMASPAWGRSVLFITYDEHGGLADHVPPPPACVPDALEPVDSNGNSVPGHFDRYGFRVPFLVVSPYARQHFVSHTVMSHASILRFVEARFGLPAMTRRDANATPPMEMFDFAHPPFMTPPTTLTPSRVDTAVEMRCNAAYPTSSGL